MKNITKTIAFFFCISILTLACKKDENNIPGGIDCNISWEIGSDKFSEVVIACVFNDNTLNIGSIGVDDAQIQIDPITDKGTYTTDDPNRNVFIFLRLEDGTQLAAQDATVTVQSLDNGGSSGTFNGTFVSVTGATGQNIQEFEVKNGQFEANF